MTTLKKRTAMAGLGAALALSLSVGVGMLAHNSATAVLAEDAKAPNASTYFYDNLVDDKNNEYTLAKKFYKALEEIAASGDFKDGVIEYSLTDKGVLTSDEIKAWVVDGNLTVPKAFCAARDSFLTDHPEIFYIDFYKMNISAGRTNGVYSAYIDSGREANLYFDNGFSSESDVNKAIASMNTEIDAIVKAAEDFAEADNYGTSKDVLKARYVNTYLADKISYDYGALEDFNKTGAFTSSTVDTAFGGLVNNMAVCSGYSRSYKAVLDKLGIPCLVVSGYSKAKDSVGEFSKGTTPHAWNYIWLEDVALDEDEEAPQSASYAAVAEETVVKKGSWYAVDVTWNSSNSNKNKYMNMGSVTVDKDHITDGIVSTSGYQLNYPVLSLFDYGCKTDSSGLVRYFEYVPFSDGSLDDYDNPLMGIEEKVSYNGKGAFKLLEEDNLYLCYRHADLQGGKLTWTAWTALVPYFQAYFPDDDSVDNGLQTRVIANTSVLYTQFAVIDSAPDINYNPSWLVDGKPLIPDEDENVPNIFYSFDYTMDGKDIGEHISVASSVFENKAYQTYIPAPYVLRTNAETTQGNIISDSMAAPGSSLMDEKYAKVYEITYDEPLRILNNAEDIGIQLTTKHSDGNISKYAKFLPLESGKLVELVGDNTLVFKFMPSLMFEHNMEAYTFTFTNVGSNELRYRTDGTTYTTNKIPNPITFTFERIYYACPRVFGYDGRLWVDCCAQPTLLSNTDLSESDFRDENGNLYSENERSQMLLVVDSVDDKTQNAMLDDIDSNSEINIKKEDIKKSETYDISLQICGKYPKISNGSYVKIALGFPEGYGPEDEGVTFRLYHYKHDNAGNYLGVEEIPCVVTKLGIVATVSSFSPYMVAVVPKDKASSNKTVLASVNGRGGKLSKEDGAVKTVKSGESCTYTVKPDEGYQIYSVTLNDMDVKGRITEDGKLTFAYNELYESNELEIKFISNEAAQRYADKNIVEPVKVVVSTDGNTSKVEVTEFKAPAPAVPDPLPAKNNTALIVILSVVAVLLAAGIAVTVVFIVRSKKRNNQ